VPSATPSLPGAGPFTRARVRVSPATSGLARCSGPAGLARWSGPLVWPAGLARWSGPLSQVWPGSAQPRRGPARMPPCRARVAPPRV